MTKSDTLPPPYEVFGRVLSQVLDRHDLGNRNVSTGMYGEMYRSESTISAYRSGRRLPPKEWIYALQRTFPVITQEEVDYLVRAWEDGDPHKIYFTLAQQEKITNIIHGHKHT